jgi:exopolysaccharide biosynthesis polyprenyl glycosylphosphotransferase
MLNPPADRCRPVPRVADVPDRREEPAPRRRTPRVARVVAAGAAEVPLGIDVELRAGAAAQDAVRIRGSHCTRARRALPALDVIWAAALGALALREPLGAVTYALVALPAVGMIEGYHREALAGDAVRSIVRLMLAAIVCGWCAGLLAGGRAPLASATMASLWAATTLCWIANRQLVKGRERRSPVRVVVLGGGSVAARVSDLIERHGRGRLEVVGFLDDDPRAVAGERRHLGPASRLETLIATRAVDRVVIAFSQSPDAELVDVLRSCDGFGVQIDVVPRMFDVLGPESRAYALGGLPMMTVAGCGGRRLQRAAKRMLDLVGASLLLVLTSPVLAVIALAIRLEDRGPILFAQRRVGRRGRSFRILKFRSMVVNADRYDASTRAAVEEGGMSIADAVVAIKADDARITRIGAFIRRTSLDELPQLWNVVRGEMSLVGPRPLRAFEVDALDGWKLTRQLERPGMTGLWQVSGRSAVKWDERTQLDYTYVRHWSLGQDLEILARTIPAVAAGDGAR